VFISLSSRFVRHCTICLIGIIYFNIIWHSDNPALLRGCSCRMRRPQGRDQVCQKRGCVLEYAPFAKKGIENRFRNPSGTIPAMSCAANRSCDYSPFATSGSVRPGQALIGLVSARRRGLLPDPVVSCRGRGDSQSQSEADGEGGFGPACGGAGPVVGSAQVSVAVQT
jgi:hypothetical protein